MPNRDVVIRQLRETSVQIGERMDNVFGNEIGEVADELSIAYSQLLKIINSEDQSKISDNNFLAAMMFWTACNTILAGLDLFRRGYSKEHLMLLRNSLEILTSAYVVHADNTKYIILRDDPDKFNSTDSITFAKKIIPLIGPMYGLLSNHFSHVSVMHMVPHKSSTPLCIGGLFDPENQNYIPLAISMFLTTVEFINCFIELIFCNQVEEKRFWKPISNIEVRYSPVQKIRDRQEKIIKQIEEILN
jgi:hypothetical protein